MLYKNSFLAGKPKRTRIGSGRKVRNSQGRTKRSGPKKAYRGQGKR